MAEFRILTEENHAEALERGKSVYASPRAITVRLDRERRCIVVQLDRGAVFSFDPQQVRSLAGASWDSLEKVVVEGAGHTLRFQTLDVDLTLSNLPGFPVL